MSITYNLKGMSTFIRKVHQKPKQAREAVSKELNRSSLRVEKKAREYAPYDTGWLSLNIYSYQDAMLRFKVVSPAHYSIYLELGTRKMLAQPFMEPALREEYPILMSNLKRMFRR